MSENKTSQVSAQVIYIYLENFEISYPSLAHNLVLFLFSINYLVNSQKDSTPSLADFFFLVPLLSTNTTCSGKALQLVFICWK